MTYIIKVFKFLYGDTLRYVAFIFAFVAFMIALMTFIAYPIQTLATIIIGGAFYTLFSFFHEYK